MLSPFGNMTEFIQQGSKGFLTAMGWILAIALSLGLNLFLFGIMPGLIHRDIQPPEFLEDIHAIQVVRVKRPDTLPKKREQTQPPKPKEPPRDMQKPARPDAPTPAWVKPRLAIELNPALPKFSNSLAMPPLSHFTMNTEVPKGLYMASELDAPLMAMAKVPPVYPLRAARLGLQGWVKIGFVVTQEGLVEQIQVLGSDPEGVFKNSVINCVSQWRFKPGTVQGVAVAAQVQTTIRFQLEK